MRKGKKYQRLLLAVVLAKLTGKEVENELVRFLHHSRDRLRVFHKANFNDLCFRKPAAPSRTRQQG